MEIFRPEFIWIKNKLLFSYSFEYLKWFKNCCLEIIINLKFIEVAWILITFSRILFVKKRSFLPILSHCDPMYHSKTCSSGDSWDQPKLKCLLMVWGGPMDLTCAENLVLWPVVHKKGQKQKVFIALRNKGNWKKWTGKETISVKSTNSPTWKLILLNQFVCLSSQTNPEVELKRVMDRCDIQGTLKMLCDHTVNTSKSVGQQPIIVQHFFRNFRKFSFQ